MGDYRQRDGYNECDECGRATDDLHVRWHRVYCSRCLPVVIARRTCRSVVDEEYAVRLRAHKGVATKDDRDFLAALANGGRHG